jgi:hypothetical protein
MTIFGASLSPWQAFSLAFSAFLAGFTKTGIIGVGMVITPLMASVFPTGVSLGFMLPLYLGGDFFMIFVMRRRPLWNTLKRAATWGIAGVFLGWVAARELTAIAGGETERFLRAAVGSIMAVVTVVGLYASYHPEFALKDAACGTKSAKTWYTASLGVFGGMASMLTNSGGPIWALYYSSLGLEVRDVINTSAWCYFLLTALKVPLSANLGFLDWDLQKLNLLLFPITIAGLLAGGRLSAGIDRKTFSRIVQCLAAGGAAYMILTGLVRSGG